MIFCWVSLVEEKVARVGGGTTFPPEEFQRMRYGARAQLSRPINQIVQEIFRKRLF